MLSMAAFVFKIKYAPSYSIFAQELSTTDWGCINCLLQEFGFRVKYNILTRQTYF